MLRRQVLDAPADPDARRVDEHVEAPEPVAMLGDDALALLRLGDVGRDRRGAELGGRRLDALGPARDERQLEAFVPQHPGDGEPDARRAAGDECGFWHCAYSKRRGSNGPHEPHRRRRLRGEVLGVAARGAAEGLRPRGGGGPPRRPRSGGRRGGLPARRRARARLHGRLLPAARRRPGALRTDRGDERAQRRLRHGRHAAARALGRGLPGGARDGARRGGLRGRGRAGARGRRDPRRRAHDPRHRAEVRARGRRHRPSRRRLDQERRPPGRRGLPDEAARHGARARAEGRPRRRPRAG